MSRLLPILVLCSGIGFNSCTNPTASISGKKHAAFDISVITPFQWGMKINEINSASPQNSYDKVWNSKSIKAVLKNFGEVDYKLYFDFDDDTFFRTDISIYSGKDSALALNSFYELFRFLESIGILFPNNIRNSEKEKFCNIVQSKINNRQPENKIFYLPINDKLNNIKLTAFLLLPPSGEFEVHLQIEKS